ncbi:hypothetical protein FI667_g14351, partial [Globisporangium splendens]
MSDDGLWTKSATAEDAAVDVAADAAPDEQPLDEDGRKLLHEERSFIFETRVENAASCRDRGSAEFKQKNTVKAIEWYERALYHVDFDEGTWHFEFLDRHRNAVNEVRLPVVDFTKVIENADLALEIDPQNTKALYRSGKAHLLLDDLDKAKKKLTLAAKNQPSDKNIREALTLLKVKIAEQKQKEKQTWGGLLKSVSAKKDGSDDENDADGLAAHEGTSSVQSSTGSSTTFWITALVILVLAVVMGFVLTN